MLQTEKAKDRLRSLMKSQPKPTAGLRLGVKKGGCSGFVYTMDWTEQIKPTDEIFKEDGS